MTKEKRTLIVELAFIALVALFVICKFAKAQEPVPEPPIGVVHEVNTNSKLTILDEAAMLRRCDTILDTRYGLNAAERREKIYIDGVPQIKFCLEYILIDVLHNSHSSLEVTSKTIERLN